MMGGALLICVLALFCGGVLGSAGSVPRLSVLLLSIGVLVGVVLSVLPAMLLVAVGLWLGGHRMWGALLGASGLIGALLFAHVPGLEGVGAALLVAALAGLSLAPLPAVPVLPRLIGAGLLILLAPALSVHRDAWWPLLMVSSFAALGHGALCALVPGRHWLASAERSNMGLLLLLAGLQAPAAALVFISVGSGVLGCVLAAPAGQRDPWARLAMATVGGLPLLGLWAWMQGLMALSEAGFGMYAVLAWLVLAVGTTRQLWAARQPPPTLPVPAHAPIRKGRILATALIVIASAAPAFLG